MSFGRVVVRFHRTFSSAVTAGRNNHKLLYDGSCPLCVKEVKFLQGKDAGRGLISFVDITKDDYDQKEHGDVDFRSAMQRIHVILPDQRVVSGVEAFRRVYEELGMGYIYAVTKLPVVGWIAEKLYGLWADYRLQLTKGKTLDDVVRERQARLSALEKCLDKGRASQDK